MTDDVIHSTKYYIKYINRAILANLQRRPLKLGRLMLLQKIGTQCVHVSAIWKFNDHLRKKAMHVSRMKDICVLSP